MKRLWRGLCSVAKLLWLMLRDSARCLGCLVSGNTKQAGVHARAVAENLHEDLMKAIGAVQGLIPLWRKPSPTIDRVLIVKLDRIGDMVNTTPVFDVLRAAFPHARLDIVGHPGPLSLLEGDDRIGERIAYKTWLYHPASIFFGNPHVKFLVLRLLWRRYPLVVYLRGSFPFLWLAMTSRFASAKFVTGEPVVDRYLKALEPFTGPTPSRRTSLAINPEARSFAQKLLDGGSPGPRIILHATASAETKMWPAERFAQLADRLAEEWGARVHFLGGPEDKAGLEAIAAQSHGRHEYHSTLRLPQVVAVIAAADLFIGNDSGLSHIAAAVETPVVVLWGPANLAMARPEAPAERCAVIYHDLPCRSGCPETSCNNPSAFECLTSIGVDEVLNAAEEFLGRTVRRALPVTLPNPVAAGVLQASGCGGHDEAR